MGQVLNVIQAVHDFLHEHGLDKTYWLAYSGGLDSHVLLSLCQAFPIKLRALHVHHGISPQADAWLAHCTHVCAGYKVEFIKRFIDLKPKAGESLEELAREKRYAIFAEYLQEGDVLLTAHQQDDQAETLLLQLLRGAGPKGLAAMPSVKPFARGLHGRPLLAFGRDVLRQYAQDKQLKWVDDESNANLKYTRNFFRHQIIPLLKTRFPSATQTISRSALHCAETQFVLEERIQEIYSEMQGSQAHTLSIKKLMQHDAVKQRMILRAFIQQQGQPIPTVKKIETIQRNVLTAAVDRKPCVRWASAEIRRFRDDLYVLPQLTQHDNQQIFSWDLAQPLTLPDVGILRVSKNVGAGLRADIDQVHVRFRRGGEMVTMPNRRRRALKNLFQEWRVPPWERERVPLVFLGERLIAVINYFIDAAYAAKKHEVGIEIRWFPF